MVINPPSAQASLSQPSSIPPVEATSQPAAQAAVSPAVLVAIRTRQVQVAEETAPPQMHPPREEDVDETRERLEEQRMSQNSPDGEEADGTEEDAISPPPLSFQHRIALETYTGFQAL